MKNLFFGLIVSILIYSCQTNQPAITSDNSLKIAISKGHGNETYEQYGKWIKTSDSSILIYDMSVAHKDSIEYILSKCDGLILTGGEDVNPDFYGENNYLEQCGSIDYQRDSLEFRLMDYAFKHNMPTLGICRGQQIINVFLGGSLIVDIPTWHPSEINHRCGKADSCLHTILIIGNNLLSEISKGDTAIKVNSSHHQAVNICAPTIEAFAMAPDSIIESIGWKSKLKKSFLLGVQFHPEYKNYEKTISGKIAARFIAECTDYQNLKSSNINE